MRQDELEGNGLSNILQTDYFVVLLQTYMESEPILTIPPSVLLDKDLVYRWFKCYFTVRSLSLVFRGERESFQFTYGQKETLLSLDFAWAKALLSAIELLQ